MQTVPTGNPVSFTGFNRQIPPQKLPIGDLVAARIARQIKVAHWHSLKLRQTFADETLMRNHIKAAGLRSPHRLEPATAPRLRHLLKRASVSSAEISTSLGTNLRNFLELNPMLPLWAAVALTLESSGRFTRQAYALEERTV